MRFLHIAHFAPYISAKYSRSDMIRPNIPLRLTLPYAPQCKLPGRAAANFGR